MGKITGHKLTPVALTKQTVALLRGKAVLDIALHIGAGIPYPGQDMNTLATMLFLGYLVQRLHQPRLDHFMLFQLLAAIVHRLEEVIEIGILGYFDTRDLHMLEEVVAKGQSAQNRSPNLH
ncbi:Uncharacterised protein [Klebsiella pneumoniae]|nr:Uncharacterised protein [Klebsiella pneumoniae]